MMDTATRLARDMNRGAGRGEGAWPWLAAGGVALSLLMVVALLVLLAGRGLGQFWPASLERVTLDDGRVFAGEPVRQIETCDGHREWLYATANRDLDGQAWRWVEAGRIVSRETPEDLVRLERQRWGPFIGYVRAVQPSANSPLGQPAVESSAWRILQARLVRARALRERLATLRASTLAPLAEELAAAESPRPATLAAFDAAQQQAAKLRDALGGESLVLESADGRRLTVPLESVLDAWRPNAMGPLAKLGLWGQRVWAFLSEGPRAANTDGGVWPAIFGTVLMVILMSLVVTPFGVLAAVYLHEIAYQGRLTRLVRIAVRNLAGVPSIVYGVFGLGVFVYGIGGTLDQWLFSAQLPSPTFGTGGLLWASLTLALLTLPVVIVATEEGLARIPDHQREGALALGATRYETLTRVVLPMALPAMLTGMILAVARAAGEVAPLMLVGVVKLAPRLPLDGDFPFLHLDSKFMHLGYHVFNLGFQSGDIESALPLVYATALLLVTVIVVLNLTAIFLRHHLRARHRVLHR
ncbi:phosphate ABC transporter permease PstA [Halomonas sp. HP20-15]|uniref:phosphate ABC transporter permease PstA n=1 Tax=Halomonas sp. HP20-15 TaxID=3085901 RepID=UPI002980F9CB|nr:phosphate ABC transporter permease PstA [Halomonas sp. HP20-15]MDW5375882.1 phosphate ABC transporter permease PstA [Halomonas sp. HP20-15]